MVPNSKLVLLGCVVGALGLSGCHQAQTPEAHVTPARGAAAPVDQALVARGSWLFRHRSCDACHSLGQGMMAGPDLAGVSDRRTNEWLHRWLKNPPEMLESDPIAKQLQRNQGDGARMPNLHLNDSDVDALLAYINERSAGGRR
jgi:nitrite reductase (NO-forming)